MIAALSTPEVWISPHSLMVLRAYAENDVEAFARNLRGTEDEQTAWWIAALILVERRFLIDHWLTATPLRWLSVSDAGRDYLAQNPA